MNYQDYEIKPQSEIATIQMNRAIMIYIEGEDYISPITLAGAAEEIFARALQEKGILSIYDEVKKSTNSHRNDFGYSEYSQKQFNTAMNQTRNLLKHRSDGEYVGASFRMEAMKMIYRAITSYTRLFKESNEFIDKYLEHEPYGALPLFPFHDSSLEKA